MRNEYPIKVSICISIYNGEEFINTCLHSVLNQSLSEVEIVIVNNGSTDSSLDLLKVYEAKYPHKIRIISQSDKGLALGRQAGIDSAKGEYLAFLDVDDRVSADAYEIMYNAARDYDADIVECQTLKGNTVIGSSYEGLHVASDILTDYFRKGDIPSMLWLRLYKRSLFTRQVMPEMYVNNEDIFATPCLFHQAKNIFFLKKQLHFYTIANENSVMKRLMGDRGDESQKLDNRLKTLAVVSHFRDFVGTGIVEDVYCESFMSFKARTILDFSLNNFHSYKRNEIIGMALLETQTKMEELKQVYKQLKHYNKFIQFLINHIGLDKTVIIYRLIKYKLY